MIEVNRKDLEVTITCDYCSDGADVYPESDDFHAAVNEFSNRGWRWQKNGADKTGWLHMCPDCVMEGFPYE